MTLEIEQGRKDSLLAQKLLSELDLARARADEGNVDDAESRFEIAFRAAGMDLKKNDAAAMGRAVLRRPRDVAQAIVAALDRWAIVRRDREALKVGAEPCACPWMRPGLPTPTLGGTPCAMLSPPATATP